MLVRKMGPQIATLWTGGILDLRWAETTEMGTLAVAKVGQLPDGRVLVSTAFHIGGTWYCVSPLPDLRPAEDFDPLPSTPPVRRM
jgi:hypothetical protein